MYHLYSVKETGELFTSQALLGEDFPFAVEYLGETGRWLEAGHYDDIHGVPVKPTYDVGYHRLMNYPKITEQLDALWHDIDAGLFGEHAKTGDFYTNIQAIKQEFPKSDK